MGGKFISSCSPPLFLPADFSFDVKNSFGASRNEGNDERLWAQRVREYDPIVHGYKVGMILACSDGSSPLQFTMIRFSSSTPHLIFAPLRALREKEGAVRPVSPLYVFAPKMLTARLRTCHGKDLCLGLSWRRSCRRIPDCRSALKCAVLAENLSKQVPLTDMVL